MLLRVTQYGENILRQKGEPVTEFNDELRDLANNMLETMYENDGIGLAAQQVGINKQLFVLDLQMGERQVDFSWTLNDRPVPMDIIMPMAMVNTRIEQPTIDPILAEEGCLSFPGVRGGVVRVESVCAHFQDLEGNPQVIECDGLFARVILHEFDHTQGVLFIDHMSKRDLRSVETRIKRIRRKTRDFLKSQG